MSKILPNLETKILQHGRLSIELADNMIENCIWIIPLPLGSGFEINGKIFLVPMAIEEPSVKAADSSITKFIAERGSGFFEFLNYK